MIEIPFLLMPVIAAMVVIALGFFVVLIAGPPRKRRREPDLVELDEAVWRDVMKDDHDILKRRFASRQDFTRALAQSLLETRASSTAPEGPAANPASQRAAL